MKPELFNRRVLLYALAITILVVITGSCRKDYGTTYIPENKGTPGTEAISGSVLRIVSDLELTHGVSFPGGVLHSTAIGLTKGGTAGSGFQMASSMMSKIMTFRRRQHYKSEFKDIKNAIDTLQGQISVMEHNNQLYQAVLVTKLDQLSDQISRTQLVNDITTIGDHYLGITNHFGYFMNLSAQWEQDTTNTTNTNLMLTAAHDAPTWAEGIINQPTGQGSLSWTLLNMYYIMTGTGGSSTQTPLKTYATKLIDSLNSTHSTKVLDTQDALNLYGLLESYFLTIMNYELQGANVYLNAVHVVDSTGALGMDSSFRATFGSQVVDQAKYFLQMVDYIFINTAEYRDAGRFQRDMRTENMGITYDSVLTPALGRAQLVANMLCAAVGQPYPLVNAVITTPQYYGSGAGPITIVFSAFSANTTAVNWSSQLPCTRWTDSTCSPSPAWTINRLGVPGVAGPVVPGGLMTVAIPNAWWNPLEIPQGQVHLYYYNPQNPSDYSTVSDSVHSIGMAFFACSWPWGTMYVDKQPAFTPSNPLYLYYVKFDANFMASSKVTTPGTAMEPSRMGVSSSTLEMINDGTFQTTNGCRSHKWQGTMSQAKFRYVIADGHWKNVTVSSDLPDYNGGVQSWVTYDAIYTMKGSGKKTFLTVFAGTTHPEQWNCDGRYNVNNEVISAQILNQINTTKNGFGCCTLTKGTAYQPGVQYFYETSGVPSEGATGQVNLNSSYQIVYNGLYRVAK